MLNKAKKKVFEFNDEIKKLQNQLQDQQLKKWVADTDELIRHNEFGVALENLLTNLYEYDYSLSQNQIKIAKEAIQEMNLNWEDWAFIENSYQNKP